MTDYAIQATPFFEPAAQACQTNLWTSRNGFTLVRQYESLIADYSGLTGQGGLADWSYGPRYRLSGPPEALAACLRHTILGLTEAAIGGGSGNGLLAGSTGAVVAAVFVEWQSEAGVDLCVSGACRVWVNAAAANFGLTVRDVTGRKAVLAVLGPAFRSVLKACGLVEPLGLSDGGSMSLTWQGLTVAITPCAAGPLPGVRMTVPADDGARLWARLARAGRPLGVVPAGLDALELVRIRGGWAGQGTDFEGLETAAGGEALLFYPDLNGGAAARLQPLRLPSAEGIRPGAAIMQGGARVGWITSSAMDPLGQTGWALARVPSGTALTGPRIVTAGAGSSANGSLAARALGRSCAGLWPLPTE